METIFKVGMEVYDSVNYPGEKGEVIKTEKGIPYTSRPIQVKFESNIEDYTLDGRIGTFNQIPTLSTSPYTLQGFEQRVPVTYEEAVEWVKKNSKDRIVYADDIYINEEYEDAFEALKKLVILRDYYNKGWQPDWNKKSKINFCIRVKNNEITIDNNSDINEFNAVLVFEDYTIRDKFLEDQRELLEITKILL